MDSRQVTLIYNGEYYGVYQLCEQIRVGKNRIDIYNWRELAEQIAKGIAKDLNIAGQDAAAYREGFRNVLQQELERDMSWIDTGVFESAGLADWNKSERLFRWKNSITAPVSSSCILTPFSSSTRRRRCAR